MPIPTYDQFIEPLLRYLAQRPEGAPARDAYEAAANALGLSETEKLEVLPSKAQAVYKNRAGWAHDRLKRSGLSSSLRRGHWKLTDKGMAYAKSHPPPLAPNEIEELALTNLNVRLRPKDDSESAMSISESDFVKILPHDDIATPDDRLERAVSELRASTAADLLETIGQGSPKFFETLVLDLLHAMGYGASRSDLQHVGRSNDGGIDGIIALDRLGLEKVFVQAKRWQGSIGREAIQAFYGALAGRRANKGVFITTSSFTPPALEFAHSVEKVVLIDGTRLADLLMEFAVGVTHRTVKIPKIDTDYFED